MIPGMFFGLYKGRLRYVCVCFVECLIIWMRVRYVLRLFLFLLEPFSFTLDVMDELVGWLAVWMHACLAEFGAMEFENDSRAGHGKKLGAVCLVRLLDVDGVFFFFLLRRMLMNQYGHGRREKRGGCSI